MVIWLTGWDGRPDTFVSADSQPPNQKIEVYPNEGSQTLAVVLQYEGVVDLAGVSAALKLPSGFKATLPLTSDKNKFDIVLSNYRGHIYPSQGVVLYFSITILSNTTKYTIDEKLMAGSNPRKAFFLSEGLKAASSSMMMCSITYASMHRRDGC